MATRKKKVDTSVSAPVSVSYEEIVAHGVSQSELMAYNECKRKRKLAQEGWCSRIIRTPLAYGALGHGILEDCYLAKQSGKLKTLTDTKAVSKRVSSFLQKHLDEHPEYNENMLELFELWATQLETTIPAYFAYWSTQEDKWDWIGIEREIPQIPFAGTFLQGRLDYAYRLPKNNIGFMDTKFKGQISEEALINVLETDFQLLFYALSIKLEFKKLPKNAIYNCIRRPSLKLGAKETLKEYGIRLAEHIASEPDHYFKRFDVPFDHTLLDDFEPQLEDLIKEYLAWQKAGCPSRRFGNPCESKYGICEYYGLCHRDEQFNYVQKSVGGYRPHKKAKE